LNERGIAGGREIDNERKLQERDASSLCFISNPFKPKIKQGDPEEVSVAIKQFEEMVTSRNNLAIIFAFMGCVRQAVVQAFSKRASTPFNQILLVC
jgi:hypothetical protein